MALELQLSNPLPFGRYQGAKLEEIIEAHPRYIERHVERGTIVLAAGAARYLREVLAEAGLETEKDWTGDEL